MARIQILNLPTPTDFDAAFVLIVDQADTATMGALKQTDVMDRLKGQTGARAVLLFPGTVDVV